MRTLRWLSLALMVFVIGLLTVMLIDATISLDHSRTHNARLEAKCRLLARLSAEGLRGRDAARVIGIAGDRVIAKFEGSELRLDDVVLRVQDGTVSDIDETETCR